MHANSILSSASPPDRRCLCADHGGPATPVIRDVVNELLPGRRPNHGEGDDVVNDGRPMVLYCHHCTRERDVSRETSPNPGQGRASAARRSHRRYFGPSPSRPQTIEVSSG